MIMKLRYNIENATIKQNIIINKYLKEMNLLQDNNKKWEGKIIALHKYLKKNNLKLKDINGNVI
jgi:hypothetical protein